MTIEEAIDKLVVSNRFKEDAKHDAKLRVFLSRYRKGEIKSHSAIELLQKYGYSIRVVAPKK